MRNAPLESLDKLRQKNPFPNLGLKGKINNEHLIF